MPTVAIYLRVSTEDQAREGHSIENQRKANTDFVRQKLGEAAEIVEYADVESGHSVVRKNYLRLIEDCEAGKINILVVWRLDRFMRNTAAGLGAIDGLNKSGVRVYSVIEGEIDFKSATSQYTTGLHLLTAEYERNRIIERVMPGMKAGARLGHYQGTRHVFYGASYDKKEKRLSWIPAEVRLLKILFSRLAKGESAHAAARYLYQQGYRNRNGKPLGTAFLCNAVRREIYTDGIYRWNGITSEKPIIEPFIDRPTWEKANAVLSGFRSKGVRRSTRSESPYILQGVLKCRKCQKNLIGQRARLGVRYYVCSTYAGSTKAACSGQWIKAEPVETQAKNIIKAIVSRPKIVEATREKLARTISDRNPDVLEALRKAERRVREIEDSRRRLLELCYKDALTADQFKAENNRLTGEEQAAKADVLALQERLNEVKAKGASFDSLFSVLQNFEDVFDNLSAAGRKTVIGSVFAWAYAKCLGRRKPKYLDEYEFNSPFRGIFQKLEGFPLSIGFRPLAAR
jgi:site-specific DNA recombinase